METHGQRPMDSLPREVIRIADVKTPGSGEVATELYKRAKVNVLDPPLRKRYEDELRESRERAAQP